jgi:hypothetical protein
MAGVSEGRLMVAKGTFSVKLPVQEPADGEEPSIARRLIDKQFEGDLVATSKGQMLAAMGTVQGSAGYVAMERVSGVLHGRKGTFALQHYGLMNRSAQSLTIDVVPDSGTDELAGLTGQMKIIIENGQHYYEFVYEGVA